MSLVAYEVMYFITDNELLEKCKVCENKIDDINMKYSEMKKKEMEHNDNNSSLIHQQRGQFLMLKN